MMIVAEFLKDREKRRLRQHARYMQIEGVEEGAYWIGPHDATAPKKTRYGIARYGRETTGAGDTLATLTLPFKDPVPPLIVGLSAASRYIVYVATVFGAEASLRNIDAGLGDEALLESLGIDVARTCRKSVGAWDAGSYLAPDGDGYAYFLVEGRGQVVTIATSATLLPVAWAYATDIDKERIDLSGKIARLAPVTSLSEL